MALPATPAAGGGNINFQKNQYRAPPAPLPNVERTLREILQPQRTITNSCIRLPKEANQFLMKSEMIGKSELDPKCSDFQYINLSKTRGSVTF